MVDRLLMVIFLRVAFTCWKLKTKITFFTKVKTFSLKVTQIKQLGKTSLCLSFVFQCLHSKGALLSQLSGRSSVFYGRRNVVRETLSIVWGKGEGLGIGVHRPVTKGRGDSVLVKPREYATNRGRFERACTGQLFAQRYVIILCKTVMVIITLNIYMNVLHHTVSHTK